MVFCKELYIRKLFTGFSFFSVVFTVAVAGLVVIHGFPFEKNKENIRLEFVPEITEESEYPVYRVVKSQRSPGKFEATVKIESPGKQKNGKNFESLTFEAFFTDKDVLRVIIRDAEKVNWAVEEFGYESKYMNNNYELIVKNYPFSFEVFNKKSKKTVFNSTGHDFYFSQNYLELKTFVNKDLLKVGITRERDSLFLGNRKISLWSNQDSPGVHPFVLELGEPSTGYLFHNYNALEVETFNNSLAFRAVGGVMDLFVFIGKTGEDIVRELHKIQGLPELPRFSALGHHYGSHSLKSPQDIKELLDFFQENSLPIDSLWLLNLSISTNFSLFSELSTFLPSNLSISLELSSEILKKTKNLDFSPILLETENEEKSYIDWFHPDAESVWSSYLSSINSSIDFTGLSLINNQVDTKEITSSPDVPFIPKDLCMECGSIDLSTVHNNSYTELDLHSLWGDMQVKATRSWFLIGNKRPLLLSSSTKTGTRAAHVISYESTSWSSLRDALASALSYEIVGIRSGSNPCGFKFNEKTSDNLCSKWQGLSAVLPLFVNFKQEEVQKLRLFQGKSLEDLKKSIEIRYSLSLFIYSLYFEASLHGGTIVRSPMFNFFDLDLKEFPSQVMIGDGLMVIFPLDKSENTKFYLPAGKWYDLDTGKQRKAKEIITDKIDSTGLFILKGGFIIPVVDSSNTMNILQVRDRFLTIIVALSETYEAKGSFFVDDGISLDSIQSKKFTKVLFRADVRDGLDIFVESIVKGFVTQFKVIEKFKIYGCPPPAYVNINGRRGVFSYIDDVLVVKTDLDTYSDIRISINFK